MNLCQTCTSENSADDTVFVFFFCFFIFNLGEDGLTSGEYLSPEDLKELGDDSLPTSHFLHDSSTYLGGSYSLARGLSAR